MKNLVPAPIAPTLDFEPVPRKYRYDGWTPERQRAFIAALAETGSVKAAAQRINMSVEGAYYLRRQPGADGFRAAWNAALDHGVQRLTDLAIDRAIEGTPVPVFWRGEQVGEKRRYSERLMMFVLRHHLPDRYNDGARGLHPGTKARATIEREAAENCPICRAAREQAEADANPDDAELEERAAGLADLLERYAAKVRYERRARLNGDIVAADFAVRQLTLIELMLCMAGASEACRALWDGVGEQLLRRREPDPDTTIMCRLIDEARHAVWEKDAVLRPACAVTNGLAPTEVPRGDDVENRIAAQTRARAAMADAQALWEAAATDAGWKAWCGGGAGQG